jgi:dTDP-4-dehydrorhamnose reductase
MVEIIVLGRGFLGLAFEKKGYKVLSKSDFFIDHNINELYENYFINKADVIINCIGKSDTRWCEKRENFSETLWSNGLLPGILSDFCRERNKKFVHISTGCLYDDKTKLNTEDGFIAAHCNYTATKWIGEKKCNPDRDLIIRPRLYFGDFAHKNNLILKMMKFSKFLDEKNSFTSVHVIVDAIEKLIRENQYGIFNLSCDGSMTIYELAEIIGLSGIKIKEKDLHDSEHVYLVNNVMDISKVKKFYNPPLLKDEFLRCFEKLGL